MFQICQLNCAMVLLFKALAEASSCCGKSNHMYQMCIESSLSDFISANKNEDLVVLIEANKCAEFLFLREQDLV